MKNLFLAVIFFSCVFISNAQSFKVDSWIKPTKYEIQNTSSIFVTKEINKKITFTGFVLTSTTGFAESLFGVNTKITKKSSIGLSLGFQAKSEKPLRFGSSFFTKKVNIPYL